MSKEEYEATLKLTKFALNLSGIKWLDCPDYKILNFFVDHMLFYFNVLVLNTVVLGEIMWMKDGIRTGTPFVELCFIAPCIIICILGTMKTLHLYLNKDLLVNVLEKLKEIHPMTYNDSFEEMGIEERIITESMKLLKFVLKMLAMLCFIVAMVFSFIPLLLTGYQFFMTGELVIKYPYQVNYLFDVKNSDWWQLIYFHQVWATFIGVLNVFGPDSLFVALCVYIEMHFRLLGLRFENIVSTTRTETKRNLAKAIERHQELIDLVNKTEILFTKSSLYTIISSSLLICLSAFNITVSGEFSTIFPFISALIASLSEISLICYSADMLMRSSMEISGSVYKCPWYELDEKTKRTILVIMRCHGACKLTAWRFVDLNLKSFTTILSRSWSYFALLKTVYK